MNLLRRLLLFLFVASSAGHAALTKVAQEPFIGPGTLTAASPGTHFSSVSGGTFNLVRVGPTTSASPAPGWSADIRVTGPANVRGTVQLTGQAVQCGMWGTWIRVKALPPVSDGYMSVLQLINISTNVVADVRINASGTLTCTPFNASGAAPAFSGPAVPLNTWVWVAVAWQIQSGSNLPYGIRCLSQTLGGSLTTWGSADGLGSQSNAFTSVNVGLETGGGGPMLRVGCPSLYSMTSFSDIAYPSDITAPVEKSYSWFVNPSTGNDANDGATAATAWKTAAKLITESQFCGLLDSNAAGPGGGDVLTINTSAAPLPIDTNTLSFNTRGLLVQPLSGQTYIRFQAEKFLANSAFTLASGSSKTYKTTDTQANIVAWENDKWLWHVRSASFGSTASVIDPTTGIVSNYPTTIAALDALPGSFYTDGTNLYIHPFGNTNPTSDGKTYTRSINRGNGLAAVAFTAGNFRAVGFYIRKTTLADAGDNSFGAYCLQDGVLNGSGFANSVEGGYFAYGDKHCFGSTTGVTNSTLLVLNTECEQGHPYTQFGGQTPFVSYTGGINSGNAHTYRNCTCLTRSGLIGSTAGDPVGRGGDVILCHNNGGGMSFASLTLDNCNFASGAATVSVCNNLSLINHTQIGQLFTACPVTIINGATFGNEMVIMQSGAYQLSIYNCLFKPVFALKPPAPYYGLNIFGSVVIEGCTFDLSGITGNSATGFQQGIIQPTSDLNLTFRNNVYVVPSGQNFPLLYGARSISSLTFDHNAYVLGGGTILARSFGAGDLTFAQWQALGKDCVNSTLNATLNLTNNVPQSNSPLNNAGADLGVMADYTGTVYTHRNTIGAYQGSAAYKAPQSISGFPAVSTFVLRSNQLTLPATTSAGLAITYTVVSGPATISGTTLTITGPGTIIITATQAGNSSTAAISARQTITATEVVPDTPTMPQWGLIVLAALLVVTAFHRKPVLATR